MKLYLSSYGLGDDPTALADLVAGGRRIGVIRNALDFSTDARRLAEGSVREHADLAVIGLHPEPLDLREHFDAPDGLRAVVDRLDALWVVGGNTFILRRAFARSGLDAILRARRDDDAFVYAGYSAGACVVTPTLRGIHLADEPEIVPAGYLPEIIWDGLGLVPFAIVPHWRSDHPESAAMEDVVAYHEKHAMPYRALRDGEVCVVT